MKPGWIKEELDKEAARRNNAVKARVTIKSDVEFDRERENEFNDLAEANGRLY